MVTTRPFFCALAASGTSIVKESAAKQIRFLMVIMTSLRGGLRRSRRRCSGFRRRGRRGRRHGAARTTGSGFAGWRGRRSRRAWLGCRGGSRAWLGGGSRGGLGRRLLLLLGVDQRA